MAGTRGLGLRTSVSVFDYTILDYIVFYAILYSSILVTIVYWVLFAGGVFASWHRTDGQGRAGQWIPAIMKPFFNP